MKVDHLVHRIFLLGTDIIWDLLYVYTFPKIKSVGRKWKWEIEQNHKTYKNLYVWRGSMFIIINVSHPICLVVIFLLYYDLYAGAVAYPYIFNSMDIE